MDLWNWCQFNNDDEEIFDDILVIFTDIIVTCPMYTSQLTSVIFIREYVKRPSKLP